MNEYVKWFIDFVRKIPVSKLPLVWPHVRNIIAEFQQIATKLGGQAALSMTSLSDDEQCEQETMREELASTHECVTAADASQVVLVLTELETALSQS